MAAVSATADAAVIVERSFRRDRGLGRGRIGPQSQIDAEHITVGGALLEKLHQTARDANVKCRGGVFVDQGRRIRIVENDQIDIAGVVELIGSHLAHGENDGAAADLRRSLVDRLELAARRGLAQQEAHG
jgi:hypothetical protein